MACPVGDAAIAKSFITALQEEYVSGIDQAVGEFFESQSGIIEGILAPFEEQVSGAADPEAAIQKLVNQWGLSDEPASSDDLPTRPDDSAGTSATPTSAAMTQEMLKSQQSEMVRQAIASAPKFGLVGSLEYERAVAFLRTELQLPDDWNMATFAAGTFLSGASGGRAGSAVIALQEQPLEVVNEFQALFDATYRKVYTRDRRGAPMPDQLIVRSVRRVMNDQVWREYSDCREKLRQKLDGYEPQVPGGTASMNHLAKRDSLRGARTKRALPALDAGVNENWLFHGTNAQAVQGIIENDFRLDLSGSNVGTLYGRGIYLAEHVSKSDEYGEVPRDKNGADLQKGYEAKRPPGELPPLARESYILVCRCLLGKVKYTDERTPDADQLQRSCLRGEYDSVLGDRMKCSGTFREIVVYNDNGVYPEFVVKYERIYFHERFAEIYRAMLERQSMGTFDGPTSDERQVIESLWNIFAMPNYGRINKWQLLDLLIAINQPPEDEEEDLAETFREFNADGDGWIKQQEFMNEIEQRVRDGIGLG